LSTEFSWATVLWATLEIENRSYVLIQTVDYLPQGTWEKRFTFSRHEKLSEYKSIIENIKKIFTVMSLADKRYMKLEI